MWHQTNLIPALQMYSFALFPDRLSGYSHITGAIYLHRLHSYILFVCFFKVEMPQTASSLKASLNEKWPHHILCVFSCLGIAVFFFTKRLSHDFGPVCQVNLFV